LNGKGAEGAGKGQLNREEGEGHEEELNPFTDRRNAWVSGSEHGLQVKPWRPAKKRSSKAICRAPQLPARLRIKTVALWVRRAEVPQWCGQRWWGLPAMARWFGLSKTSFESAGGFYRSSPLIGLVVRRQD
jgi:hypothetical protein